MKQREITQLSSWRRLQVKMVRSVTCYEGRSPILMVLHYVWERLCTWKSFYRLLLFLLHSFSVSKRLPLAYCSLIYLVAFPAFSYPAPLYVVHFFFFSFLYSLCMCLNLSPGKKKKEKRTTVVVGFRQVPWSLSCLYFCLPLPILTYLTLSFAVIYRLLASLCNQTFHFHARFKNCMFFWTKTTKHNRNVPSCISQRYVWRGGIKKFNVASRYMYIVFYYFLFRYPSVSLCNGFSVFPSGIYFYCLTSFASFNLSKCLQKACFMKAKCLICISKTNFS